MSPIRLIFRMWVRTMEWLTLRQKPTKVCHLDLHPLQEQSVDIVTIAFNNADLIAYQTPFLEKFIQDRYTRIIADNSTDPTIREAIYQYCLKNNITYIGLPKNYANKIGGSYSHATAINYVYRHVIQKRQPWAWGIMDHDLFPTRPISIADKLSSQPIYGPLRHRDEWWYLSAIMSFWRYDWIKDKHVDFMPVTPKTTYLDSGGGNWYDLYSRLDLNQLTFPNECIEPLRDGGDRHSDSLEFFDDKLWLHTINGSCWKKIANNNEKQQIVKQHLDAILAATTC